MNLTAGDIIAIVLGVPSAIVSVIAICEVTHKWIKKHKSKQS